MSGWPTRSRRLRDLNVLGAGAAATDGIGTMTEDRWQKLADVHGAGRHDQARHGLAAGLHQRVRSKISTSRCDRIHAQPRLHFVCSPGGGQGRDLDRPSIASAEILPREAYVSEQFFAFEKQAIFAREWLCIGHVNEVPNPGDYLPLTILEEPILLVRDDAGTVRVLSSICQHRGHPIVGGLMEHTPGTPCLHGTRLVCPYHNWTYGLDGRLIGAPGMQDTTPVSELRKHIRLPEIRSEIFHGLVFINFDADAEPLAPRLAKLDREFATYPVEQLIPAHVFVAKDLHWNWKLHHENALEPYHTDYVHKGYHNAVPSQLTRFCDYEDGDGQVMRSTGFLIEDGDLFETKGRRLPEVEGLTPRAAQPRHVRVDHAERRRRGAAIVRGDDVDQSQFRRGDGMAARQPLSEGRRRVPGLRDDQPRDVRPPARHHHAGPGHANRAAVGVPVALHAARQARQTGKRDSAAQSMGGRQISPRPCRTLGLIVRHMFDLVIRNGRLVAPDAITPGTIGVSDGSIAAIAPPGEQIAGADEIDATGMLILPGLVDAHVHIPGFLLSSRLDDFTSASKAAAPAVSPPSC